MNRKSQETQDRIAAMLLSGFGNRETAEYFGVSTNTVKLIARRCDGLDKCRCGAAWGHKGWCKARFAVRPKRQQFMEIWQSLQALTRSGEIRCVGPGLYQGIQKPQSPLVRER